MLKFKKLLTGKLQNFQKENNMKKILVCLVLVVLVIGCRAKKSQTNEKEVNVIESNSTVENNTEKEKETVSPPIIEKIVIKEPCDEKGKIKPFDKLFVTGRGKVRVYTDSVGDIQVEIDLPAIVSTDKVSNRNKEVNNKKERTEKDKEVKIIEVVPFRYWIYLVISLAVNALLLYLWLRGIFKRKFQG